MPERRLGRLSTGLTVFGCCCSLWSSHQRYTYKRSLRISCLVSVPVTLPSYPQSHRLGYEFVCVDSTALPSGPGMPTTTCVESVSLPLREWHQELSIQETSAQLFGGSAGTPFICSAYPPGSIAIAIRAQFAVVNGNLGVIKRNETEKYSTLSKLFLCQGSISFPSVRSLSPLILHEGDQTSTRTVSGFISPLFSGPLLSIHEAILKVI